MLNSPNFECKYLGSQRFELDKKIFPEMVNYYPVIVNVFLSV